jgi:hypothetical protein
MLSKTERGLLDINGQPIINMNGNWTSKPYQMNEFLHLGVHLFWNNPAVQGTMILQYTCDPVGDSQSISNNDVDSWVDKNVVNIDGTFDDVMFLDANLPITAFRLLFLHISGSADLVSYVTRKKAS